jgi:hypothetical protein
MKCFAVSYSGVEFYNCETKEEAEELFKKDSAHKGETLDGVEE